MTDTTNTAADLAKPALLAEERPTIEAAEDRRYDSIDPATGQLTAAASARRQTIRERLTEEGKEIISWFQALGHPDFGKAVVATDPDVNHEPADDMGDAPVVEPEPEPVVEEEPPAAEG
jgi:hypothetical protein